MSGYFLGVDIGTTAIKGVLLDPSLSVLSSSSIEHIQSFPRPGWVEQDPVEHLFSFRKVIENVLRDSNVDASLVTALGFDHQGETCLVWEKKTGKPVYPAITWQDRRMTAVTSSYPEDRAEYIRSTTGVRPDSYYSAWKIRWILDNVRDGQKRAENGELLAGTLNTWIIWNLTKGESFVTDQASASVTMLFNPRENDWDSTILSFLDIPRCILPRIQDSDSYLGTVDPSFFGAPIPIRASFPDCSAAIVASGEAKKGGFICTYGTGSFMHLVTGDTFVPQGQGLTSSCSMVAEGRRYYQLNGISYTAGAAVKWLRDSLSFFKDASETEAMARSVKDTGGVYFVPAFNGLATPRWDQSARGAFLGITGGTTKCHLVRAVLESAALQVACNAEIMKAHSALELKGIKAIGGMTGNSFLMQLQADLLGFPVTVLNEPEPAVGSAYLAADASGLSPALAEMGSLNPPLRTYMPQMDEDERLERIRRWNNAVERTLRWYPE